MGREVVQPLLPYLFRISHVNGTQSFHCSIFHITQYVRSSAFYSHFSVGSPLALPNDLKCALSPDFMHKDPVLIFHYIPLPYNLCTIF